MEERPTTFLLFLLTVFASMIFALPLSNNGMLTMSVSEAKIEYSNAAGYKNAVNSSLSFGSGKEARLQNRSLSDGNKRPSLPLPAEMRSAPILSNDSFNVTFILLGTGLVGIVGIGRNQKKN